MCSIVKLTSRPADMSFGDLLFKNELAVCLFVGSLLLSFLFSDLLDIGFCLVLIELCQQACVSCKNS